MGSEPPVSVILPTVEWTDACAEVAAQLDGDDELLVVSDAESDPVVGTSPDDDGVRIVLAGDPEGCSGKANAIAAGMEAATHDRLVWTDDDFAHPPGWLDGLRDDYDRQGPTTEVPFFVGRDPLALLLEPLYAIGGTLAVSRSGIPWAGGLIFERDDLDEQRFLDELRRTVSDDGLLGAHLHVTAADRVRLVPVGGSFRASLERHVRFVKIVRFASPGGMAANALASGVVAAACLAYPLVLAPLLTFVCGLLYASFGVRRWTFLLAFPAATLAPLLVAYALARRTFVWGGRRYRWRSTFDVTVENRR